MGRLGGSVGWAADFGSGHDLTVREFEPRRRALCWQLRAWSLLQILCLPLSDPPPVMLCLSLKNKSTLKKFKKKRNIANL